MDLLAGVYWTGSEKLGTRGKLAATPAADECYFFAGRTITLPGVGLFAAGAVGQPLVI
jgi:hypothetical protein